MILSKRGSKLVGEPQPLVQAHFKCAKDPFHPVDNEDGYINLGTAENHLMFDVLGGKLNQLQGIEEHHTHYDVLYGSESFRNALASFMSRKLNVSIEADKLAIASGSSAIIDMLVSVLCDAEDGIIIPSPYYPGFDHDLKVRSSVEPVPAYLDVKDEFKLTKDVLQEAVINASKRDIKVKALIITSPNNPLGRVYTREELEMCIAFCKEHKLELIADELYACSVFDGSEFVSLLELASKSGLQIHHVYGFAKDFTLSGFKVGCLYSTREEVLEAVRELTYFSPVSTHTQHVLSELLNDETFVDSFISTNQQRLNNAWSRTKQALDNADIPYVEPSAGFFVWIDLSKYLKKKSFDSEMDLYNKLVDDAKVNISPGKVFHCEVPGWFRVCYARPEGYIELAINRILDSIKK